MIPVPTDVRFGGDSVTEPQNRDDDRAEPDVEDDPSGPQTWDDEGGALSEGPATDQ